MINDALRSSGIAKNFPPSTSIRRIALIGNSPPRQCGLATFTDDLRAALQAERPDVAIDVYAMNDPGARYDYPGSVVRSLAQEDVADYVAAARSINASGADIVCIQHEYGIFGGVAGVHLLQLVRLVTAPMVVTMHTIIEQPSPEQRGVIEALIQRSAKIVVMAEKGREILMRVHGVPEDLIVVIPHGVPDHRPAGSDALKHDFGLDGRKVLLTFGLLSPGKGIETMIRAMPAIAASHPDALYVVLGATHPHLVAQHGESHRAELVALAEAIGVASHVRFVGSYLSKAAMLDWLSAADIHVTPYRNEAQITSGTLSLAMALGKPIISTPYWHAAELLRDGAGALAPFNDSAAFAREAISLLGDDRRRLAMERKSWATGRTMIWTSVAKSYFAAFQGALGSGAGPSDAVRVASPRLDAVVRLTDDCGIIQHGIFTVPDRSHGYCLDDNCRALMLMHRISGNETAEADRMAITYAAFVQHAWDHPHGRFRNFLGYDRTWLEVQGSNDSFGRALWSLGDTAQRARSGDLRTWACHLFDQAAPHAERFQSPRTLAFCILGLDAMLQARPGHAPTRELLASLAHRLVNQYLEVAIPEWSWFEPVLAYDNARLPQALILAGRRLDDAAMLAAGLASLIWLTRRQTNAVGQFRPVGTDSFGRRHAQPLPFDQQPVDAWATIDAAIDALSCAGDPGWAAVAQSAYAWFLGENDLGLAVGHVADGGCSDGLMADRVNRNQGAESVLAFQFASCAMRDLARTAAPAPARDDRPAAVMKDRRALWPEPLEQRPPEPSIVAARHGTDQDEDEYA